MQTQAESGLWSLACLTVHSVVSGPCSEADGREGKNAEEWLPRGTCFTGSTEAAMEFRALEHPVHVWGSQ